MAIGSLADMETLFKGIPLEKISTSMTTNAPAADSLVDVPCRRTQPGAELDKLRGTIQNDILKEYIAQKTVYFPPRPSMKHHYDTV